MILKIHIFVTLCELIKIYQFKENTIFVKNQYLLEPYCIYILSNVFTG